MPRRRVKQTVKQRASSRGSNINSVIGKKPQIEKQEGKSIDQDGTVIRPFLLFVNRYLIN